MAARFSTLRPSPFRLLNALTPSQQCLRHLHKGVISYVYRDFPLPPIPPPTPFVPNVQTFLKLIGRGMSKYESAISSWDDLFNVDSVQLREKGIENTRERRYLLRWREKFRRKEYGIGGDLDNVTDGVAELRAVQVPREHKKTDVFKEDQPQPPSATINTSPGMKWQIVNPPLGQPIPAGTPIPKRSYSMIHLVHTNTIKAPFIKFIKGTNRTGATLTVQEGMWEHKLGRKIDGGERRRAMVRAKRRSEERKKGLA